MVRYDWSTWCTATEDREERFALLTAHGGSGDKAAAARRPVARSKRQSKRHPQNDWHARSLAKTRRPLGLRALAAIEHADDDTDNIYIYIYTYMSPAADQAAVGHACVIAVPSPTVDLRTVGRAKELARRRCASVASPAPRD